MANSLADAADAVAALVVRGRVREAEVATAFLALWLIDRVETGQTAREQADEVFTALDVLLTGPVVEPLSQTWRDLVTEGEHFHHFGGEWGADPATLRELANTILEGRGGPLPTGEGER